MMQLIICTFLNAQNTPLKQWDTRFGGNNSNLLFSTKTVAIANAVNGGFIFGTNTNLDSSGDKTSRSRGSTDFWVIRTDNSGNKIWDAGFGGSQQDFLSAILPTTDGYILGGSSNSGISGDKSESNKGDSIEGTNDYWIVKIDTTGNKIWDKTFGGTSDDELSGIQPTGDGGFLLAGTSASDSSGDRTQASQGKNDYWILKIDANGNKLWDRRFGGSDDDFLAAIEPTTDGGFLLGGASKSGISGDKTQAGWGNFDYWIVKIDANGNKIWDKRFGGSDDDRCNTLSSFDNGYFLLGGFSQSGISGDRTQASWGFADFWILKIDASGNKIWDKRFGGDSWEGFGSIQKSADGNYFLAGSSQSTISGDKTQSNCSYGGNNPYDYWVVKVDSDANKLWDVRYGGDSSDLFATSIVADDGLILLGNSNSNATCDKSQAAYKSGNGRYNTYDLWLVKLFDVDLATAINKDRDGLNDYEEFIHGTDPLNFDTNGDGLADGVNVFTGLPPLNTDTDSDGISNAQEVLIGTSPILKDTDGDGIPDNLDPFPLDRYRTKLPAKNLSDHTPPVIILSEPPL